MNREACDVSLDKSPTRTAAPVCLSVCVSVCLSVCLSRVIKRPDHVDWRGWPRFHSAVSVVMLLIPGLLYQGHCTGSVGSRPRGKVIVPDLLGTVAPMPLLHFRGGQQ